MVRASEMEAITILAVVADSSVLSLSAVTSSTSADFCSIKENLKMIGFILSAFGVQFVPGLNSQIKHTHILEDTLQNRLGYCSAFSLFLCVSVLLTVTVFPIQFLPEKPPFPSHLGAL